MDTLKKNGNAIDQKYAPLVEMYFPKYEVFWSNYIGCESGGGLESKSKEIYEINSKDDHLRKLLGQWNYSILMDFVHLQEISQEIPEYSTENYTQLERTYLLAVAIFSNAIDCIEKIYKNLGLAGSRSIPDYIEEFGLLRNIVIHDVRPLIYINRCYNVLKPESYYLLESWPRGEFVWTDLNKDRSNYLPLAEFISRLYSFIIVDFNAILDIEISEFRKRSMPKISSEGDNVTSTYPSAAAVEEEIRKPTPSASVTNRNFSPLSSLKKNNKL